MNFDANKTKTELIKWIHDWFMDNGKGCNAVLGISGGKDSSVVAALCVEALGKDHVIGVLMPNGIQNDIDIAKKLVQHLGIKYYIINIADCYTGLINQLETNLEEISSATTTNLPARLRMSTVYAISQSNNGRVANTCNLSEDWVGYSTRYGDSVGDFSPLSYLTVHEVRAIGIELNLPSIFVDKIPTDGLCGKTDEENLGFTYEILDKYIRTGICDDIKIKNEIDKKHRNNLFKLELMPCFKYESK